MTPQDALAMLRHVVEQTTAVPQVHRQLAEALDVLDMAIASKPEPSKH